MNLKKFQLREILSQGKLNPGKYEIREILTQGYFNLEETQHMEISTQGLAKIPMTKSLRVQWMWIWLITKAFPRHGAGALMLGLDCYKTLFFCKTRKFRLF